jgi:hypothetical protein
VTSNQQRTSDGAPDCSTANRRCQRMSHSTYDEDLPFLTTVGECAFIRAGREREGLRSTLPPTASCGSEHFG